MPDQKKRMVIFMEGGLIQQIIGDSEIDVFVLDADVEGAEEEEEELIKIRGAYCLPPEESNVNDSKEFYVGKWNIEPEPQRTEFFVKQIQEQEKK